MSSTVDAWADLAARGVLLDLEARGIVLAVSRGNLTADQADRVTDADRARLRELKAALLLLVLANSKAVLDRLAGLRRAEVWPFPPLPGACRSCGDALPPAVPAGACGWCTLAARQHRGAPLSIELLGLFPVHVVGDFARDVRRGGSLLDLGGAA